MSYDSDYDDDVVFGGSVMVEEEKYEPINFLEKYSISSFVTDGLTLEEQELVANKLVEEVLRRASKSSHPPSHPTNHRNREVDTVLPEHLEKFKLEYEKISGKRQAAHGGVQLPLIRQMSPRTAKKASLLPPPTEIEQAEIDKLERYSKSLGASSFYKKTPHSKQAALYSNSLSQSEIQSFYQGLEKKHVLVSDKVKVNVGKQSTKLYEDGANYKTRRKHQDEIRAQLLDHKVKAQMLDDARAEALAEAEMAAHAGAGSDSSAVGGGSMSARGNKSSKANKRGRQSLSKSQPVQMIMNINNRLPALMAPASPAPSHSSSELSRFISERSSSASSAASVSDRNRKQPRISLSRETEGLRSNVAEGLSIDPTSVGGGGGGGSPSSPSTSLQDDRGEVEGLSAASSSSLLVTSSSPPPSPFRLQLRPNPILHSTTTPSPKPLRVPDTAAAASSPPKLSYRKVPGANLGEQYQSVMKETEAKARRIREQYSQSASEMAQYTEYQHRSKLNEVPSMITMYSVLSTSTMFGVLSASTMCGVLSTFTMYSAPSTSTMGGVLSTSTMYGVQYIYCNHRIFK